jgi:hypothetical protein
MNSSPLELLRDPHTPIWRVEEVLHQHPDLLEPKFRKDRFGNPEPDSPAYNLLKRNDLSLICLQAIANIRHAILPLELPRHPNINPDILEQVALKHLATLEQHRNPALEDKTPLDTQSPNLLELLQAERFWRVGYRQIGLWELQAIHTMLTDVCIHPKLGSSVQTMLMLELCKTVLSPYQLGEIGKAQHELLPLLIAANLEVYLAQLETTPHHTWLLRDLCDFAGLPALQPTDQQRLLAVLLRFDLTLRHKISLSFSPHPALKALADGIDGTQYRVF